ncbi:hypothetical protein [Leisingera sp. S232]|uniref:hypothetical protein n=1 Tax=Leisingera sp. S232 TaxID=3415132 RepID=UPI003C7A714E
MDQNFQERLCRISSEHQRQQGLKPARPGRLARTVENSGYPIRLLLAVASGLLSVLLARYIRFHLVGVPEGQALFGLGTDLVLALASCWAVTQFFKFDAAEFKAAQAIGVTVMAFCMHNLAHWVPVPMETLFSKDWVVQQQKLAPPNSLYVFGFTFQIGEPEPSAAAKPPVVYRN